MTVATAFAVSWKPLTNSKLNDRNRAKNKKMAAAMVTGSPHSSMIFPLDTGELLNGTCRRRGRRAFFLANPAFFPSRVVYTCYFPFAT